MSTLQISLAIVGGLVLAGVVAYSAWVARKNVPRRGSPAPARWPRRRHRRRAVPNSPKT